jgi:SPP1 family predicted phage head-tail adaptor
MNVPTIGELKTRVTFQQPITMTDNAGGQIVTWQSYGTRWGAIRAVRGSEVESDAVTRAQTRLQVIVRADDSIHTTWRCVIESVIYIILTVYRLDGAPQWIVCALERKEGI